MRTPTRRFFGPVTFAAFATLLLLALNLPIAPAGQSKDGAAAAQTDQSATAKPASSTEHAATTNKDQVDLAVTVYNSNLALVRDVRQIHLPTGSFLLWFEDVAASINPATVHFRSLNDPGKLNVIEQNYEY